MLNYRLLETYCIACSKAKIVENLCLLSAFFSYHTECRHYSALFLSLIFLQLSFQLKRTIASAIYTSTDGVPRASWVSKEGWRASRPYTVTKPSKYVISKWHWKKSCSWDMKRIAKRKVTQFRTRYDSTPVQTVEKIPLKPPGRNTCLNFALGAHLKQVFFCIGHDSIHTCGPISW